MQTPFIVEISAKHIHITEDHFKILFGSDASLTKKKDLSQPGQYACEERLDVVGTKRTLKNVIILGPFRPATQVELSVTDCLTAGITAPIRESGDIAGSGACTLVGPAGEVEISEGVIVAKRHIHMTGDFAAKTNVTDNQIVKVRVESEARTTIFDDVVVRVSNSFSPAMHIDTDEGNAAFGGREGIIVP